MIAVIAKLKPKAGSEAEFEQAMTDLAQQVRANEPGNQLYTLCRDEDGNYAMLELYDDERALEAHRNAEHFQAAGKTLGALLDGAPEITRYSVVG